MSPEEEEAEDDFRVFSKRFFSRDFWSLRVVGVEEGGERALGYLGE